MKKLKIIVPILVSYSLWAATTFAETQVSKETNQPAYAKLIPPEKLKEDLDFLFKTIEEVHPNMYAYTSKQEFMPLHEKLYSQITQPMNRLEFYKLVAPVVAELQFGHTFISGLWENFRDYCNNGGKVFPIELELDGQQAFLVGNYGKTVLPIGGTLLSINGEDTASVIFRWARYSPSEGRNADPRAIKRRSVLWMYLWLEYGDAKSVTLRIKSLDGKTSDHILPAISGKQAKAAARAQRGSWTPFSYTYMAEHETGLIKINQFDASRAFREFLEKTFKELNNKKASNLIVDIRKNPGGSSIPGDWLLEYLTDKPFAQFEGVVVESSEKPFRFGGRICVLIGRLSASSSVSFASAIKCYRIGTLIGEETGDATVNYGEARRHELPNSGLQVTIPTKYFVQAGGKPGGRGVLPDYEVKQKPADTANGVDTALEFTLDLIEKGN